MMVNTTKSVIIVSTKKGILSVFACADIQDSEYDQAIPSVGTGCLATLDVDRYLTTRIKSNEILCIEEESIVSTIGSRNGITCIENLFL